MDASVAVKLFVPEADSERAAGLLASGPWRAPDLVLVEVMNACWRAVRRGAMSSMAFHRASPVAASFYASLTPASQLIEAAAEIALALDHPVYDCMYLALARQSGEVVVTADVRLLRTLAGTPWASLARAL